MQEFMLPAPTQVTELGKDCVEDTEETARNKQSAREKMSGRMRRVDEGKTVKSIWGLPGYIQTRVAGVKEGEARTRFGPQGTITRP